MTGPVVTAATGRAMGVASAPLAAARTGQAVIGMAMGGPAGLAASVGRRAAIGMARVMTGAISRAGPRARLEGRDRITGSGRAGTETRAVVARTDRAAAGVTRGLRVVGRAQTALADMPGRVVRAATAQAGAHGGASGGYADRAGVAPAPGGPAATGATMTGRERAAMGAAPAGTAAAGDRRRPRPGQR